MSIRDNRDCIRVLVYSYYTTITGWGVLLSYHNDRVEGLGFNANENENSNHNK